MQVLDGTIDALDRFGFEKALNTAKNVTTAQRDVVDLLNHIDTFPHNGMVTWRDLAAKIPPGARSYLNKELLQFVKSGKPTKILPLTVLQPDSSISANVKVYTFRFIDGHKRLEWPNIMYDWSLVVVDWCANPHRTESSAAHPNSQVFSGMSVSGDPTELSWTVLHKDMYDVADCTVRAKCLDSLLTHFDEWYCLQPGMCV